jgi:hypothetical protein
MADPVLPALDVAIGAIGLLVNVRNGIDMIIRDKDHVKGFIITDIALAGWKITLLSNQLLLWKRLWMIPDHTSYSLFVDYWGTTGASRVHEVLETTEHISRQIQCEFNSKFGKAQADAHERLQRSGGLAQHEQTSEGKRQQRLQGRLDVFNLNYRLARRARLALFNSPTFQRHLKTLQESIEILESLSVSEFQLHHDFKYDAEAARKMGLRSHLLDLANRAAESSVDLIEWCKHRNLPPTMAIDLQLDLAYGSMIQPRHEYIAQRANQKGFPYYLRLPNYANAEDRYQGFAIQNETKFEALKHLVEQLSQEDHRGNGDGVTTQNTESLRQVLSIRHQGLLKSLHHQFSLPERYKLAYELSESALVLLASTSLCELCVCAIRRFCHDDAEHEYEYYMRINNAHGLKSWAGDVHVADRWCRKELLDMHICRLGVVLAEICTGTVAKDVRYDSQSEEVRITLNVGSNSSDQLMDCCPEEVADLVKDAAGVDLSGAVYYCLRRNVTPERVGENDLLAFYNRVVAP